MNPYSRGFNIERHVVGKVDAETGITRQAARSLRARKADETRTAIHSLGFQSRQIDHDTARSLLMMIGR